MQECSGAEAEIGLEVFFTDSPGIGGRLKQDPEDFIVDEISLPPSRTKVAPIRLPRLLLKIGKPIV